MIKLIVSDIDGTLVEDGGNQVDPRIFETVMRLKREKKIQFAAASGRQAASIEYTFAPIRREIFYLAENGAYLGCFGRNLFLHPMIQADALALASDISRDPRLEVLVSGPECAYLEMKGTESEKLLSWVENGYHFRVRPVADLREIADPIIKVSAYRHDGIQDAAAYLQERYGERMKLTFSGDMWMDCMAKEVNKGEAVQTLQESLGILPEETVAFGDQLNDLEMLGRAYYSFAVANARPEVRQAARFQADRNTADGVLKILQLFL